MNRTMRNFKMTEKLTTEKILQLITSSAEFKNVAQQMGSQYCDEWSGDPTVDLNRPEYIKGFNLACNPKKWKRVEKRRWDGAQKPDAIITWDGKQKVISANFDDLGIIDEGDCNEQLRDKALQNWIASNYNDKDLPMFRMFLPRGDLEDSFRLEVFTTSDDTEIICWTSVGD